MVSEKPLLAPAEAKPLDGSRSKVSPTFFSCGAEPGNPSLSSVSFRSSPVATPPPPPAKWWSSGGDITSTQRLVERETAREQERERLGLERKVSLLIV